MNYDASATLPQHNDYRVLLHRKNKQTRKLAHFLKSILLSRPKRCTLSLKGRKPMLEGNHHSAVTVTREVRSTSGRRTARAVRV